MLSQYHDYEGEIAESEPDELRKKGSDECRSHPSTGTYECFDSSSDMPACGQPQPVSLHWHIFHDNGSDKLKV